jgi:hypothetical protein
MNRRFLNIICSLALLAGGGALTGCDSSSPAPAPSRTNAVAAVKATNSVSGSTNVARWETNSIFEDIPINGRNPFFHAPSQAAVDASASNENAVAPTVALPTPKPETILSLTGIIGTPHARVALINGRTFEEGDEAVVRSGETQARVRCIEIGAHYAVVQVDGKPESLRLLLKKSTNGVGD